MRYGGRQCTCGRKGCLERYASATALVMDTEEAMEQHPESLMPQIAKEEGKVNGRVAFKAARAGDPTHPKQTKHIHLQRRGTTLHRPLGEIRCTPPANRQAEPHQLQQHEFQSQKTDYQ